MLKAGAAAAGELEAILAGQANKALMLEKLERPVPVDWERAAKTVPRNAVARSLLVSQSCT